MRLIIMAFLLILLLIVLKVDKLCERVLVLKFKQKENYCVMFTKEGLILISKKCFYGERVVCGRNYNKTIFVLFYW